MTLVCVYWELCYKSFDGKEDTYFLSVRKDCPIYFANTYLNATDRMLRKDELLSVIDVVQNGVFIESDF